MNERIKELAEQAEIRFKKLYIPDTTYVHESPAEVTKERLQKFAELLIRECAQHLTNIGQDYCREQIEKHFGVES